jgi:hypothetical protein
MNGGSKVVGFSTRRTLFQSKAWSAEPKARLPP